MSAETLHRAAALMRDAAESAFMLAVADWLVSAALTNCHPADNADAATKARTGCIEHAEALAVARTYLGGAA